MKKILATLFLFFLLTFTAASAQNPWEWNGLDIRTPTILGGKVRFGSVDYYDTATRDLTLVRANSTYIVYMKGGIYYAKASPETGLSDFSNADFVDLMDLVMGVVGRNGTNFVPGNKIVIREGSYYLSKQWIIQPTQDFELDAGEAEFGYHGILTTDAIVIDSCMNSRFKFGMIWSNPGTTGGLIKVKPTTIGPDGSIIAVASRFDVGGLINSTGSVRVGPGLVLEGSVVATGISKNNFFIDEINFTTIAISIPNPNITTAITHNNFYFAMHNNDIGLKIGSATAVEAANVHNNNFYGVTTGVSGVGTGIDIYSPNNSFYMNVSASAQSDVILRSGAQSNLFVGQYPDGITNNSGNTSNIFHSQNGIMVNRGDPGAFDWTLASFTTDFTWRVLDCSAIVPAGVRFIWFRLELKDDAANSMFYVAKNGDVNVLNKGGIQTQVVNQQIDANFKVACDQNRQVQYIGSNTTFTMINLLITGWEY